MTLSAPKKKERMGTTAVERSGRAAEGIEARAQGEKVFIFLCQRNFTKTRTLRSQRLFRQRRECENGQVRELHVKMNRNRSERSGESEGGKEFLFTSCDRLRSLPFDERP